MLEVVKKNKQLRDYLSIKCKSNLRARTILYIYICCSVLIILTSTYILCSLQQEQHIFSIITQEISQTLEKTSKIIFDLDSKKQSVITKQSLEVFWIIFVHSLSQPLISLHRLYNFQQLQTNIQINKQQRRNQNCYNDKLNKIETACLCSLNNTNMINSNQDDLIDNLQNLIQFNTALPIVKIYIKFIRINLVFNNLWVFLILKYNTSLTIPVQISKTINCINQKQDLGIVRLKISFQFIKTFNIILKQFSIIRFIIRLKFKLLDNQKIEYLIQTSQYIEAQKIFNENNFQQYSVRLTGHYLTIPFNDIIVYIKLILSIDSLLLCHQSIQKRI